jgi:hypothetical protein
MTNRQLREQEVQIARYQFLSREVTDPLAACLLRVIVEELEADLRRDRDNAAVARALGVRRTMRSAEHIGDGPVFSST